MKNDFEREMVICMNRFFTENKKKGFAYRLKQSHFNTQYVDIIVDSLDPAYYMAIECKSLNGTRLYFTSNFHKDKDGVHQVDNISGFVKYTGRRGYLAVEFRGQGPKNEAYLMPWNMVLAFFEKQPSIPVEEFRSCIQLERVPGGYRLPGLNPL
ncbi:MAG: Holliday junction resolvase [Methanocorpusculum sp.]|jgi:Holliday junction resolvase|nr:Holliday junction resolvase [Methanocorpusculum sp.]MDD2470878.1 Holliday junction resolvase [Methanocorpusculum sp.]MDD3257407.1 Holliday junction resolvase [Methanocorpusculum sp.]MDD4132742.1 Holliday junction resolvase [Methanocorpusculum sp.]